MNAPSVFDRTNSSSDEEETNKDPNYPVVYPKPSNDFIQPDSPSINEQPVEEVIETINPMDELHADEKQFGNLPYQEFPAEESVAETEIIDETIPYPTPVIETFVEESEVRTPIFDNPPIIESITPESPVISSSLGSTSLLSTEVSGSFRSRWLEIQGMFVDDPRAAVQEADALVSEVVEKITQMFSGEHSSLESQWKQGNDVSTEDLRKALQHYRSFFNRLVV